jgi:hypothetical protein
MQARRRRDTLHAVQRSPTHVLAALGGAALVGLVVIAARALDTPAPAPATDLPPLAASGTADHAARLEAIDTRLDALSGAVDQLARKLDAAVAARERVAVSPPDAVALLDPDAACARRCSRCQRWSSSRLDA